jgi:hypothetical protein
MRDGYCNLGSVHEEYMKEWCRASCEYCSVGTARDDETVAAAPCVDEDDGCASYRDMGHCDPFSEFKEYMQQSCARTCLFCKDEVAVVTECKDNDAQCSSWAEMGHCLPPDYGSDKTDFSPFMETDCALSCSLCTPDALLGVITEPPCVDNDASCGGWKDAGHCAKGSEYHNFMTTDCRLSCGLCTALVVAGAPEGLTAVVPVPPSVDMSSKERQVQVEDAMITLIFTPELIDGRQRRAQRAVPLTKESLESHVVLNRGLGSYALQLVFKPDVSRDQVQALIDAFGRRCAAGKCQVLGQSIDPAIAEVTVSKAGNGKDACTVNQRRVAPTAAQKQDAAYRRDVAAKQVPSLKHDLKLCISYLDTNAPPPQQCRDTDPECVPFKDMGLCNDKVYMPFMQLNCSRTCVFCCDNKRKAELTALLDAAEAAITKAIADAAPICEECPVGEAQPATRHNQTACLGSQGTATKLQSQTQSEESGVDSLILIVIVAVAVLVLAVGLLVVIKTGESEDYNEFSKGAEQHNPIFNPTAGSQFAFIPEGTNEIATTPEEVEDLANRVYDQIDNDAESTPSKIYAVPMDTGPYGGDSYAEVGPALYGDDSYQQLDGLEISQTVAATSNLHVAGTAHSSSSPTVPIYGGDSYSEPGAAKGAYRNGAYETADSVYAPELTTGTSHYGRTSITGATFKPGIATTSGREVYPGAMAYEVQAPEIRGGTGTAVSRDQQGYDHVMLTRDTQEVGSSA